MDLAQEMGFKGQENDLGLHVIKLARYDLCRVEDLATRPSATKTSFYARDVKETN